MCGRFLQQLSEVGSCDGCLGDMMEGVQAVVYFPLDVPSVILGGAGSDDTEIYRNVHAVGGHAFACCRVVTMAQVMSVCQMALSKGVQAFVLCVNQSVNIPSSACKQGCSATNLHFVTAPIV